MTYDKEVAAAVAQARRRYGVAVDPALVHAIIQRETGHRPVSAAGTLEPDGHRSYGPMQVKDTTAAMHGINDPKTLVVPSIGIRIGTYELARLLVHFNGDVASAVSGYNAGQGNAHVDRAGRFPNQGYVDAVLAFWRRYGPAALAVSGSALVAVAAVATLIVLMQRRPLRRAA